MSDSEGKKSVGVFGGILAAIGLLLSKGLDDCARIGASTARVAAPAADDVARGVGRGAPALDDLARGAGRGAPALDDVARGAGRGAPALDDVARGAGAGRSPAIAPVVLDDAVGQGARGASIEEALAEQGVDLALQVVSFDGADDADEDETAAPAPVEIAAPPRAGSAGPGGSGVLALMPLADAAYTRIFGEPPAGAARQEMVRALAAIGPAAAPPAALGRGSLGDVVARRANGAPLAVLGYSDGSAAPPSGAVPQGPSAAVVLPSGERAEDTFVHRACARARVPCVILSCSASGGPEPKAGACLAAAHDVWRDATRAARDANGSEQAGLTGRLLDARARSPWAEDIVISRVHGSQRAGFRVVRSHVDRARRP